MEVPDRHLGRIVCHRALVQQSPQVQLILLEDGEPLRPVAEGLDEHLEALRELELRPHRHRQVLVVITGCKANVEIGPCVLVPRVGRLSQCLISQLVDHKDVTEEEGYHLIQLEGEVIVEEFIDVEPAVKLDTPTPLKFGAQFPCLHADRRGVGPTRRFQSLNDGLRLLELHAHLQHGWQQVQPPEVLVEVPIDLPSGPVTLLYPPSVLESLVSLLVLEAPAIYPQQAAECES